MGTMTSRTVKASSSSTTSGKPSAAQRAAAFALPPFPRVAVEKGQADHGEPAERRVAGRDREHQAAGHLVDADRGEAVEAAGQTQEDRHGAGRGEGDHGRRAATDAPEVEGERQGAARDDQPRGPVEQPRPGLEAASRPGTEEGPGEEGDEGHAGEDALRDRRRRGRLGSGRFRRREAQRRDRADQREQDAEGDADRAVPDSREEAGEPAEIRGEDGHEPGDGARGAEHPRAARRRRPHARRALPLVGARRRARGARDRPGDRARGEPQEQDGGDARRHDDEPGRARR